jgi:precorrin-3B synthase
MTAHAILSPRRRGACPGLSAPMPTGDGLLVRLLPIGTMTLTAFVALCAAAREHGNGIVEITARGSIQVRGLSAESAPRFADAVAALNIAAADGIPVLVNPLAGLDGAELTDAGALAADLRLALAQGPLAARLAPKVSVAIDGGGSLGLDGVPADVRLCAEPHDGTVALQIGVGGNRASAAYLGSVAAEVGVEAAMHLLDVIARRGRAARARDVVAAEGDGPFRAAIADLLIAGAPPAAARKSREAIGTHRLRDGSQACGIALAFGHADTASLARLAEAAEAAGAAGFRAAPGRTLIIIGLTGEAARPFVAEAERHGFIVRADDPRRRVIACAGAPICASAYIAARSVAPDIADSVAPPINGSFTIHLSGCGKGCAHAGAAALTVVGTPAGCALIADGSVRDAPFAVVATDDLPAAIARHVRATKHEPNHV